MEDESVSFFKRASSGERVSGDGGWMDSALDRARHYLGEESFNLIVVAICITLAPSYIDDNEII
jgi:hypothetical protein